MPAAGRFHRSPFGADLIAATAALSGSQNTFVMAALNACFAARFMAQDTRDIKTVYVNFFTVSAAGTIQLRIETVDATTGKPTGTLYDANAVKSFTPVSGWQAVTFDTLPTTGLTAGTEYAIVLITTVAGTTQTLRSNISPGGYPSVVLTAADGSTRSNLAEIANSVATCSVVFEDDIEEGAGMCPFVASAGTNLQVYGTRAWGCKLVVPTGLTFAVKGVELINVSKTGSPGDIRCRIFNSSDVLVSGCTRTLDKDSLTAFTSGRKMIFRWPSVNLDAGTYRVVFDQPDTTTTSGNRWNMPAAAGRSNAVVPSGLIETSCTDIGTPVWTDDDTKQPAVALVLDDITADAGGGSSQVLSVFVN